MSEKDAQLAETKKLLSGKQVTISELEQDLVKSRMELKERESRLNDSLQVEVLTAIVSAVDSSALQAYIHSSSSL